ncbi:MAG TPA: signal peptide peptidase SppA, partial [Gemmatimonadales bacterium]|nr:signal peptide peptidase SppA [Gemmatimonadales bacterium]
MKVLVRILAVIGGLVILGCFVGLMFFALFRAGKGGVSPKTVLEVNLEQGIIEDVPDDPVAAFTLKDTPVMRDVVEALEKAGNDDRVVGLVARVGAAPMGMAQLQELRNAVLAFRAKKKPAVAFAETFGEFGPGGGSYYLATAFDEIWLQPSGDIGLTGVFLESPFLRGTLDKLGVKPRMDHRYEFKNAMNFYTDKKYDPYYKEAMEKLMSSWFSQMTRGISESRHLTQEQVVSLVDKGPFLGKEAQEAGLVDGMAYRDEVYAKVKKKAGEGATFLYLEEYLKRAGRPNSSGKTIALIYGVGAVSRGDGGYSPFSGEEVMGSDHVTAAFREAVKDPDVKAILFRVDSPGGSYVASDAIWRETVRAKKAGKPVVVSMGNLAGSGGYFVAMAADKIVAQPGTITASIGVLGGKFLTSDFWEKVGLSWDSVHTSTNSAMWTGTHDYSPAEWARFQAWLDRVYTDFTGKVAEGRNLPKEKVLQIAKGRIWTGEDAKGLGLVDELGGFPEALLLAKKVAKIPEKEEVNLKVYPPKRSPFQMLFEEGPHSSDPSEAAVAALARDLKVIQPYIRRIKMLAMGPESGVL